jgi:phosphinothricin acetyltransferase
MAGRSPRKTAHYKLGGHAMPQILIRPSTVHDLPAATAIYGWHVRHGTGTFEIEPPTLDDMARRRDDVLGKGLPYLVADHGGEVCGYAYANQFRPRPAYRFCLEDSVYIAPDRTGRGLGKLLLVELLARCEAAGARQMLAVIGDSANAGSIGLHRALGFAPTGTIRAAGWKFERWLDVVVMQRSLGPGAAAAPA